MCNKLGHVSISFRDKTPEQILSAMAETGLSHIEWGSDVHAPKDEPDKLREIVQLQQQYGITCCAYGTYFRLGETPLTELPGYIRAAKLLGTNILRLWCGNKNAEEYSTEEKAVLFAECKKAAKIGEAEQVVFCMECHNNTYTNRKEAAAALMAEVHSKSFRMYWQPNQFRTKEENISYAKQIRAHTENIHVFNWKETQRYPLSEAVDVWSDYLACLPEDAALLLEFMPDDRIESLSAEASALKEICKRRNLQ